MIVGVGRGAGAMTPYAILEERFRRVTALDEVIDFLYWDQVTMMPERGNAARGEHIAVVSLQVHELLTAADLLDLIDAAAEADLDPWQRANLVEMRRKHVHAAAVEPALIAALSR